MEEERRDEEIKPLRDGFVPCFRLLAVFDGS